MLFEVGELSVHLGLYGLESAGASLLACPLDEDVVAANHGDGVSVEVGADPSIPAERKLQC